MSGLPDGLPSGRSGIGHRFPRGMMVSLSLQLPIFPRGRLWFNVSHSAILRELMDGWELWRRAGWLQIFSGLVDLRSEGRSLTMRPCFQ
jgi:hypothetical protein